MGSRIAAHFSNAGVPALLLDVPGSPNRNAAALKGIQNVPKQRPAGFFTDDKAALIEAGNFDDDLSKISGCDWIIEAIVENLEPSASCGAKWKPRASPGRFSPPIPAAFRLRKFAEGFPPEFRRHFLGTHFFNPPRYLHLMELIPGPETDRRAFSPTWNNSPIGASAKAWCAPKTLRTSSPIASAAFLAAPSPKP